MSSCPICLETISSSKASPDVCDHLFCLPCLTKWKKVESFCPVDRKRFRKIIDLDTGNAIEVKKQGKKRKARSLYDISTFCEGCKSGDRENTLLLCDSCDLAYHCECLSPPLKAVPSGRWFCPVCSSIDQRLGEGSSSKPRKELNEPLYEDSCPSIASHISSEAANSSNGDSSHLGPITRRQSRSKEGNISRSYQSLSASSSNGQINAVKISKEDYQTLRNQSKSLFLAPGISVSPKRKMQKLTVNLTNSASPSSDSLNSNTNSCGSSECSATNSGTTLNAAILLKRSNSRSSEKTESMKDSSKSSPSLSVGKVDFISLTNSSIGNKMCDSDSSKGENNVKDQLTKTSGLSILREHLSALNENPKLDLVRRLGISPTQVRVPDSGSSSDCEYISDGSKSGELLCTPRIQSISNQAERKSSKISCDNQSVASRRPTPINCLLSENSKEVAPDRTSEAEEEGNLPDSLEDFGTKSSKIACDNQSVASVRPVPTHTYCSWGEKSTEIALDHVSDAEDEGDFPDSLEDFETRNSQYAAKAKKNLPEELKKIEKEKWKRWTPHKSSKVSSSSTLLRDIPRTEIQESKTVTSPYSKRVFNITDYSRRVKKRKLLHGSEILDRYKAFVARSKGKSHCESKLVSSSNLNVFQGPFSQCSLVRGETKLRLMNFNPSDIHRDTASSLQFLKTCPAVLHVDYENLSVREDGSLFLNWSLAS